MELHQYRTDGNVDVTPLRLADATQAKLTALSLVAHPAASGVYRICFVDEQYDRTCWDTYHAAAPIAVGTLMYAGAS